MSTAVVFSAVISAAVLVVTRIKTIPVHEKEGFQYSLEAVREKLRLLGLTAWIWVVAQAVALGLDPIRAIQMATLNPARYFNLPAHGAIAPGKRADLVILDALETVATMSDSDSEVLEALVALGYSVVEAQTAVQSLPKDAPDDVEERLRLALGYFQ